MLAGSQQGRRDSAVAGRLSEARPTEHIFILTPEAALDLATTYVRVTSPFKVLVISSPGMIPGTDRNPVPSNIGTLISAPTVIRSDNEFIVSAVTWKQLGGHLEKWTITVLEDGTLQVHVQELASWIGAALGLG